MLQHLAPKPPLVEITQLFGGMLSWHAVNRLLEIINTDRISIFICPSMSSNPALKTIDWSFPIVFLPGTL